MRRLSYYYYSSGSGSWVYGAIIASVVAVILILVFILGYCRRKKRLQQQQAMAQPQTQMAGMPSYPTPQYATPYTPTPMGYPPPMNGGPPPMNGAPPVWFNNRSLSRADMEAMSTDQLNEMGARMGLSDQAHLPRPEYIDLLLATHASMAPAASAPVPPPFADTKPTGGSFKNPATGLMECGLCMENMGPGTTKAMAVPPCGHAYCYDCLRRVATEGNGACPACRKNFFEFQITKIYT